MRVNPIDTDRTINNSDAIYKQRWAIINPRQKYQSDIILSNISS